MRHAVLSDFYFDAVNDMEYHISYVDCEAEIWSDFHVICQFRPMHKKKQQNYPGYPGYSKAQDVV